MNSNSFLAKLTALFVLLAPGSLIAQEEPAVLERYVLGLGQNADGTAAAVHDKFFGGGSARANVAFLDLQRAQDPEAKSGALVLHVARVVPRGTITFALLVFGIEIRGYDEQGELVYSKDLEGFTFGDSQSGRYTKTLRNLPLSTARLEVTFRGNYE